MGIHIKYFLICLFLFVIISNCNYVKYPVNKGHIDMFS